MQFCGLKTLGDGPGRDGIGVELIQWTGWGGLGLWCPIKFCLEDHKVTILRVWTNPGQCELTHRDISRTTRE